MDASVASSSHLLVSWCLSLAESSLYLKGKAVP